MAETAYNIITKEWMDEYHAGTEKALRQLFRKLSLRLDLIGGEGGRSLEVLCAEVDTIKAYFASDNDGVINKWNEVVSFLAGIADTETLDGLLAGIGTSIAAKLDTEAYNAFRTAYDEWKASVDAHTGNQTIHVTQADRDRWDRAASNAGTVTGIRLNGQDYAPTEGVIDLGSISLGDDYAKAQDLTSHTGNTTIHVTAAERTAWNGKQDALAAMSLDEGKAGTATTARTITAAVLKGVIDARGYITGITKTMVTTALGYTPPTSDTNTWRGITDTYNGSDSTISLSQKGGKALYDALLNGYASSAGNATTAGGLAVHGGRNNEANKIVRTDGNGVIQAGWINTTSGDTGTTAIDKVYCSNDGYIRYKSLANFKSALGLGSLAYSSATIPTNTNQLTNGAGFITAGGFTMSGAIHQRAVVCATSGNVTVSRNINTSALTQTGTITFNLEAPAANTLNVYTIDFTSNGGSIGFNRTVTWLTPATFTSGKHYEISIKAVPTNTAMSAWAYYGICIKW